MELSLSVIAAIFIFIYFSFSVTSVIVFLQASPKLKQTLADTQKHWALKYVIYYGIAFSIFVVVVFVIAMVFVLANFMVRGF